MIDTQALRKKVVDLAIQGKLTEQLPEDGDAETLYAQIQEEKAKLIEEGKIKKEKPLPEIEEDEIPFEIPTNWKWVRLYEISDTNIGLTYHPEDIVDEGIVVLRSNNIKNGVFDYSDLVHVNCEVRENQYIRQNDILICSRNGSKNLVGKCAIYDGELGEVSFGAFMAILRTSLYKYVYYYLTTYLFRRYFSNDDTKQINQVTQDILKKAIVPLPPLKEQKRIVDKLENVLSQIDIIDDLQTNYSNDHAVLKSKIIDAGVQGKLTKQLLEDGNAEDLYAEIRKEKSKLIEEGKIKKEKNKFEIADDEIPFEIPDNWKWVRIGDIFTLQAGKNISASLIYEEEDDIHTYKCYGGNGCRGYVEKYNTSGEHVLIGRQGALCGNVNLAEGDFYATEHAVVVYHYAGVNAKWIEYVLRYLNLNQYATATAQPGLAVGKIEKVLLPLPPLGEQKRIVEKIESILKCIE